MCPSMADRDAYASKPKKLSSQVSANPENPSKYFNQFLYKAIIVTIFLVIVPLLPSQAPEFVNQNLQYSRSWELLQLIFVGIAVSYGLFSKRNDETDKEHNNSATKFDNAQSYVARLLQVSSVFDDDTENTSVSDDNKIQTWNSQYHREEPMVLVAEKSPVLEKQNATTSRIDEKPLLLPVRSLKSRVSEPSEREIIRETTCSAKNSSISSRSSSNSGSIPKRFSSNSGKSRNGELNVDENMEAEANVVLRSPIPWRSRSGRMEMREDDEDGLTSSYSEDSELKKYESSSRSLRSHSFHLSRPDSAPSSPNKSSTPLTTPYFSYERQQAKSTNVEDVVRKKIYEKPSPPPAPPPPPPSYYRKSPLEKSNSSLMNSQVSPQKKELRRSVRSVPNEFIEAAGVESLSRRTNSGPDQSRPRSQNDVLSSGKSVRTIRSADPLMRAVKSVEFDDADDAVDKLAKKNEAERELSNKLIREKEEYFEKVLVETDESSEAENEDDYFEESVGSSSFNEAPANVDNSTSDEGPDVDKKADEFIAKFREQIRLQRIESIRRSTEQHPKKQSR